MRQTIHRIGEQRHRAIKRGLLHRRSPVQQGGGNGERSIKRLLSTRPHCLQRFLIKCPWSDALKRECEPNNRLVDDCRDMFESRISAGGNGKLPAAGRVDANITVWSYDLEGHAKRKSMQRYCEVSNKKTPSTWIKSPHLVYRPKPVQEGGRNWQRWENCQNLLSNRSQMSIIWRSLCEQPGTSSYKVD